MQFCYGTNISRLSMKRESERVRHVFFRLASTYAISQDRDLSHFPELGVARTKYQKSPVRRLSRHCNFAIAPLLPICRGSESHRFFPFSSLRLLEYKRRTFLKTRKQILLTSAPRLSLSPFLIHFVAECLLWYYLVPSLLS